jgi:hypothetical protein
MANLNVNDLTTQIDKLLTEYKTLRERSKYNDISDLEDESNSLVVRLRSAIERLAPAWSTYIKEMNAAANDTKESTAGRIRIYIGILEAFRADADEGWLLGISELLHADTLSDFIEQADELAQKKYENAAAVVVGSALEAQLRLLCNKYGISVQLPSGQPKKADALNAELAKASAYNSLQQKAVTSWQAIRNAAAHGEYDKYTREQVLNMISSVRDFVLAHPA